MPDPGQVDLAIVLKAILDAKGFEQAQSYLKGYAYRVNETKPALDDASKKVKGLGDQFGGTRGPVADLTRVLLQNIGVTGAAGEVAKTAGAATYFLGGAVSFTTVAATGFVAVAALVLPYLVEWFKKTKDAGEAHEALKTSLDDLLPQLKEYLKVVKNAQPELKALADVLLANAFRDQKDEAVKLSESNKENRKRVEALDAVEQTRLRNLQIFAGRTSALTAEEKKQREEAAESIVNQEAKLNALLGAIEDGVLLTSEIATATDHATEASKRRAKALEDEKKRQEELNAQLQAAEAAKFRDPSVQAALARDSEALAKREAKAKMGALDEETAALLVQGDTNRQTEEERQRLIDQRTTDEKQAGADKRATDAATLAAGTASLTSFFGNNKAARIAQAIVDTYAAATRALAELGPIAGPVMAGVMIAVGLANVATIRKQEVGFDDPFNDLLAAKMGRKSAADFVRYFGIGFQNGMQGAGGGPSQTYHTHRVDRSTHYGGVSLGGFFGTNETEMLKYLNRKLIQINRHETRTKV